MELRLELFHSTDNMLEGLEVCKRHINSVLDILEPSISHKTQNCYSRRMRTPAEQAISVLINYIETPPVFNQGEVPARCEFVRGVVNGPSKVARRQSAPM
jgi:hypothetical protein